MELGVDDGLVLGSTGMYAPAPMGPMKERR